MAETKRVVVVGGGVAGSHVVKGLQFQADVTLIDPKEYFEIPWAQLRCMVEPNFAERCVFDHKEYFLNGRLVDSSAVNATDTEVVTASGERIPYDYLVIGSGSTFNGPPTKQERLKQFQTEHEKISNAQTILIIGGGPTGVELAGEIKVDFPDKKVILIHKGSRLIDFLGPKASKKAFDWLVSNKVEVHLNESIDLESLSESTTTFTARSGMSFYADCHFVCVGRRVDSSWLQDSVFKESVDNQGHLKVDESLRLRGKTNVFAVGDITDIKEIKQGFLAEKHAQVVASNIQKMLKGSMRKLTTYKAASPMAMVSLGRNIAVAQLPFGTMVGCLPGRIKSRGLFVGKTRKGLGLKS
uniref:FAD/NAD(P)-binding domain-containing protein n=1 Tax=Araucaria cunninghamii TaxID=56994 RepID=A0A0D6R8G9_ARACU